MSLIAPFFLAVLVAVALLLSTTIPAIAFAETETEDATASGEIAEIEELLYKIFRSPGGYAALIGGRLPTDTELPVTFEIAIPAGSEILWFGEISGGPREDDRSFPQPYTLRTEGDFDIYAAITYEHVIQIEYLLEDDPFEALGNGEHRYFLSYTPLHDAEVMRMAAYLPKDSDVADPSFTNVGFAPQTDEPLYMTRIDNIIGGDTYERVLSYGPPAAIARQGAGNLNQGLLMTLGVLALTAVAAGAFFFIARQRRATALAEYLDDEDEYEYDDEN